MEVAKRGFGKGPGMRKAKSGTRVVESDDDASASRIVPQAKNMSKVPQLSEFDFSTVSFNDETTEGQMDTSIRVSGKEIALQIGTVMDPRRIAFGAGPWTGLKKGMKRSAADTPKPDANNSTSWSLSVDLTMEEYLKYIEAEKGWKQHVSKVSKVSIEVVEMMWQSSVSYDPNKISEKTGKPYDPVLKISIALTGPKQPVVADVIALMKNDKQMVSPPKALNVGELKSNHVGEFVFNTWRIYLTNQKKCGIKWELCTCNRVKNKSVAQSLQPDHSEYTTMSQEDADAEFAKYEEGGADTNGGGADKQSGEAIDAEIAARNAAPM